MFYISFKGGFPIEDGVLHGPLGRYYLPVLGNGKGKTLTRTATIILVSAVLAVTALILVLSNWLSKDNSLTMPDYVQYLGMTQSAVVQELELQQGDITELSQGVYKLPEGLALYGIDFNTVLYFEEYEGVLNGYAYTADYKADPKTAARDVAGLLQKLGYNNKAGEPLKLDKSELSEPLLIQESWNATSTNTNISTYLEHLENSEFWEGRVAGYLAIPAVWYRDLNIRYDPEAQQLSIELKYAAEPRRTGVVDK